MRWAWAVLLVACTANDDVHPPRLASITPDPATPGSVVQLDGAYFCGEPDAHEDGEDEPAPCDLSGTVYFGTVPTTSWSYSDTMIAAEVPALAPGSVTVTVSVAGRVSNGLAMTIE